MHARQSRALRGIAAAAVATWTAALSHTLGGGAPPDAALLLVVTALAAPLGVALAGRRLGVVRLTLTVVAAQALLHVGFAWTAGLDPSAATTHLHGGSLATGAGAAALFPDLGMTAAHALAAVLTVAALHRGERALRAVARGLRDLVARLTPAPPTPISVAPAPASAPITAPALIRVAGVISPRGPPAFVTAAH